jgi:hypothetical protein
LNGTHDEQVDMSTIQNNIWPEDWKAPWIRPSIFGYLSPTPPAQIHKDDWTIHDTKDNTRIVPNTKENTEGDSHNGDSSGEDQTGVAMANGRTPTGTRYYKGDGKEPRQMEGSRCKAEGHIKPHKSIPVQVLFGRAKMW